MNSHYDDVYIPQIIKFGRITGILGIIIILSPLFVVSVVFGIRPDSTAFTAAVTAQIVINFIWWLVEPVSYFPILGIPGTFVSFLSGNGSNLRIPCAAAAQKAAGVSPGTKEGSIISTIGICCSVFVNIILLTLGVIFGASLLSHMPAKITDMLTLLLPALFGAVFAQFAIEDIFSGIMGMFFAITAYYMYKLGLFNWLPLDPSIVTIVLPIFGTVISAKFYYSRKK